MSELEELKEMKARSLKKRSKLEKGKAYIQIQDDFLDHILKQGEYLLEKFGVAFDKKILLEPMEELLEYTHSIEFELTIKKIKIGENYNKNKKEMHEEDSKQIHQSEFEFYKSEYNFIDEIENNLQEICQVYINNVKNIHSFLEDKEQEAMVEYNPIKEKFYREQKEKLQNIVLKHTNYADFFCES